ncbi:unnamed protein product [Heligmosomoides polygyrus]|uniref:Transposase n=1 Tax=Heligmosomoides polygyrus TaxID=6339 RepID=A0A183FER2_HELPZ|nr:unnamed protein product [Heligmosomoides polygyrus]
MKHEKQSRCSSRHVCRCLASGKTDSYTYVVMSLLGKELSEIRRRLPNRKISLPSTLRISIQVVRSHCRHLRIFMKPDLSIAMLNQAILRWDFITLR